MLSIQEILSCIFFKHVFSWAILNTLFIYTISFRERLFIFFLTEKTNKQTFFNYPSLTCSQQYSYMATENTCDRGKQTETIQEAKGRSLDDNTVQMRMGRKGSRYFEKMHESTLPQFWCLSQEKYQYIIKLLKYPYHLKSNAKIEFEIIFAVEFHLKIYREDFQKNNHIIR